MGLRLSIKKSRQSRNLTQEKVAEKSGISLRYFQAIEDGQKMPSIKILYAIAKALGVSTGSLIIDERSK